MTLQAQQIEVFENQRYKSDITSERKALKLIQDVDVKEIPQTLER